MFSFGVIYLATKEVIITPNQIPKKNKEEWKQTPQWNNYTGEQIHK